ncbi:MAG: type II toxin-antitoxin system RelE/ParE family toxin [Alteromonas sp.]|nr:type II toxin-antitoxin system RelE/ParE family toxin [Alteromonas sp.]
MVFHLTPQAQQDLKDLLTRIALDDTSAAYRVRDAILETCDLLADNPKIATELTDLFPGVYRMPVYRYDNYVVFFTVVPDGINIVRLGWGGRDWLRLL